MIAFDMVFFIADTNFHLAAVFGSINYSYIHKVLSIYMCMEIVFGILWWASFSKRFLSKYEDRLY